MPLQTSLPPGDKTGMREILRRIDRTLSSLKLTAATIASLIIIYFLGLLLPQKWMFNTRQQYDEWLSGGILYRAMDAIGFTDIYMSPLTLVLLGLFFTNLLVVMVHRSPVMFRRAYIGHRPDINISLIKSADEELHSPHGSDESFALARETLGKSGFRVLAQSGNAMIGIKNRLSPLGFLFFHYSFLICLIGGLLLFYTRFSGMLVLTEGQVFNGDIKQFRVVQREPRLIKELPAMGLRLNKVKPYYEQGVTIALEAEVQVMYDGVESVENLNVNQPLKRGPYSVLVNNIGVSPLFKVLGPSNRLMDGAYVALNILGGEKDSFQLSDEAYEFDVRFYPDHAVRDGLDYSRSPELKNPVFNMQIKKNGINVYDGQIRPGEGAPFGIFRIGVDDIKYWVEFIVVREYGMIPLVTGFLFAAIGLVMRLVFYQKRISVLVEDSTHGSVIYISGRSEYFPHSFNMEVEQFRDTLAARLIKET